VQLDSDDAQNTIEVGVVEKLHLERTFAQAIAQLNPGAETLAQFVFHCHQVRIAIGDSNSIVGLSRSNGWLVLQPRNQFLGLANSQSVLQDALGSELVLFRKREAQNYFCMPNRDAAI